MTKQTGDEVRIAQHRDKKGQDIEPQAEEWEAKQSQQDKPNK